MKFNLSKNTDSLFSFRNHKNVNCLNHLHESIEIAIVNKGLLNVIVCDNTYELQEKHAILIAPYESHFYSSVAKSNECTIITFSYALMPYFAGFLKSKSISSERTFELSYNTYSLIQDLIKKHSRIDEVFLLQAILSPLLFEATEKLQFTDALVIHSEALLDALIYMEKSFLENITLESVAKKIGVHPVTLSKILSKEANITFTSQLNYLRIHYAADKIRYTDSSFADIAFDSGFASIRNFNRIFKKHYGMTPSDFKDKNRLKF